MGDRWGAGVSSSEQYIRLQGPEGKKTVFVDDGRRGTAAVDESS